MRARGFPRARIALWRGSYVYVGHPDRAVPCFEEAAAVFAAIEGLRPASVRHRPAVRRLLAEQTLGGPTLNARGREV